MHVRSVALGALLLVGSGVLLVGTDSRVVPTPVLVVAVASLGLVGWSVLVGRASRPSP